MWYVPKNETLYGFRAIKHKVSGELCLSGLYGEIYQFSDKKAAVAIYSGRVATKELGVKYHNGEESIVYIPNSEVSKWVKIIKVPKTMPAQIRYAETR